MRTQPLYTVTLSLIGVANMLACAPAAEPTPAQARADVGPDAGEVTVLDPSRSYPDRLRLLELLEQRHPYPDGWPDHRAGIELQTAWQLRSGRTTTDDAGLLDGWWPNVNYTLSVWQFQAQQQLLGEFPEVRVVTNADARFDMPEHVAEGWVAYYEAIDAARADADAGLLVPTEASARARDLQRKMWAVHVDAVHAGLAVNEDRLASLPPGEDRFSTSWGVTAVDFLAVANFPSDEENIDRTQRALLPERIVTADDYEPGGGADLSWHQRQALFGMERLHESEQQTGGALFRIWRNAAARPRCDALCSYLMDQGIDEDPSTLLDYMTGAVSYIASNRSTSDLELQDLSCDTVDADGPIRAVACETARGTLSLDCTLAVGVRDWNCRGCPRWEEPAYGVFAHLFCPSGSPGAPAGTCEVRHALRIELGGCDDADQD